MDTQRETQTDILFTFKPFSAQAERVTDKEWFFFSDGNWLFYPFVKWLFYPVANISLLYMRYQSDFVREKADSFVKTIYFCWVIHKDSPLIMREEYQTGFTGKAPDLSRNSISQAS